jgi:hypothetical protein
MTLSEAIVKAQTIHKIGESGRGIYRGVYNNYVRQIEPTEDLPQGGLPVELTIDDLLADDWEVYDKLHGLSSENLIILRDMIEGWKHSMAMTDNQEYRCGLEDCVKDLEVILAHNH